MRLLVNIATGPENPTRLALGLFVARIALGQGHQVDVFLAGDGVHVLRPETRDLVQGIGTGKASEHWTALREGGAGLYASGLSSKARGLSAEEGVELVPPDMLVRLIEQADRVISY